MMSLYENVAVVVGLVSGMMGLISLCLPVQQNRPRLARAVTVFFFVLIASLATYQASELRLRNDIGIQAETLTSQKRTGYTYRGYVHASLAFLERHRAFLPDTYERAVALCRQYDCDQPGSDVEMVNLSYTFDGMLKGLSTIAR